MLNLNTILYIIKCIFYRIFHAPFVQFLSPQLFWHCFAFFRCFPVTITPLFQNTGSCSFIPLTMPFPSFIGVFSSASHNLCFPSGLFVLFCFFYSSSFPSTFSHRLLSLSHFFSSVWYSLYLSHCYFLFTFCIFLLLYLPSLFKFLI